MSKVSMIPLLRYLKSVETVVYTYDYPSNGWITSVWKDGVKIQ